MNLIFFSFLVMLCHPIHVTLTNIEIFDTEEKGEITFKIFSDDFEIALENYSGHDLIINSDNETNELDTIISSYINSNFSIIFDNKKHDLQFLSKNNNHEATWLNFKITGIHTYDKINIKNTLLLDLYDDQKNLLIFKKGKLQKGFNLSSRETEIIIAN